ncbi:MAG: hypothetical protein DLM68_03270 [Hyphomicrobiales bacterium]|nr:MAG: hypothetical protein DLM68_03270 [Hyphomicrobiales bacterium]
MTSTFGGYCICPVGKVEAGASVPVLQLYKKFIDFFLMLRLPLKAFRLLSRQPPAPESKFRLVRGNHAPKIL